jgi:hypothetical protein
MAEIKPVLASIPAFDPKSDDLSIRFLWKGNKLKSFTFKIYQYDMSAGDYKVVFQKENIESPSTSYTFQNSEIKDKLNVIGALNTSDFVYVATVTVTYDNGERDDSGGIIYTETESDGVSFKCYDKPEFRFQNLRTAQIITNSFYTVYVYYSQKAGEELRYFNMKLYTDSGDLLMSSDNIYDTDEPYQISGLNDGSWYVLEAYGITVEDTELQYSVRFKVRSNNNKSNLAFESIKNLYCDGYIQITTNINVNLYEFDNINAPFLNHTSIDLYDNGITYINSTGLQPECCFYMKFINPKADKMMFRITDLNGAGEARIYYREFTKENYSYTNTDENDFPVISTSEMPTIEEYGYFELIYENTSYRSENYLLDMSNTWEIVLIKYGIDESGQKGGYFDLKVKKG